MTSIPNKHYSISQWVQAIAPDRDKIYICEYPQEGYEMGVGRAGRYQGHSHRYFVDVIFSPSGYCTFPSKGERGVWGQLLVVPPLAWLDDIQLGVFFFMKFSPIPGPICIPDKVVQRLSADPVCNVAIGDHWRSPWYPTADRESFIIFKLENQKMKVYFEENIFITVGI